jgi:serine/threonine protein kinase/Tfp pilus assembly protein PilF
MRDSTDPDRSSAGSLPVTLGETQLPRLPGLDDDLRRRWQRGERLLVEDYLRSNPALQGNLAALVDLIRAEIAVREAAGETAELDEYLARFAEWSPQLRHHFERFPTPPLGQAPSTSGDSPRAGLKWPAPPSPLPGYELLGELGHGGMGVVYKARHVQLNRIVALKMIRAGVEAGPEELARFRNEAETVARLQHPNVVQIHEVGEYLGWPFFALEYVNGGGLDKALAGTPQPARDAAELVATLARAMHVVHQSGIVHRDLKPGNVLLQMVHPRLHNDPELPSEPPEGRSVPNNLKSAIPKITDFGLAKLLPTEATEAAVGGHTQSGAILGTASYMAPEQARGRSKDVGPAADVYALGAILYEILTGRPPFKAESTMATLQQVLSDEPVAPTRLQPRVPRDLDTICLKCLQKEPRSRYESAQALADDLGRFVAGRPILARPIGRIGRLTRWARREPLTAALVGAFLLALVSGLTGVSVLWRRAVANFHDAQRHYARAEESSRDSRRAVEQMLSEVGEERLKNIPEMEPVRRALLEKAAAFYEKFLRERGDDPAIREEAARAYERVGLINQRLGRLEESHDAYQKALAMLRALVEESSGEPHYRHLLAQTYYSGLGYLKLASQHYDQAEAPLREGLQLLESLVAEFPDVPEYQKDLADCYNNVAVLYLETRQFRKAEAAHANALKIRQELVNTHPGVAAYQDKLAGSYNNLGLVYRELGQFDQAEAALNNALSIWNALIRDNAGVLSYQHGKGLCYYNLGWLYLHHLSKPSKAAAAYEEAVKIRETLARDHPAMIDYQSDLTQSYLALVMTYGQMGQSAKADAVHQKLLEIVERLPLAQPNAPKYRHELANTYHSLAWYYQSTARMDKAEQIYDKALTLRRQLVQESPRGTEFQRTLGQLHHERGILYCKLRRLPEGVEAYKEAIRVREQLLQEAPSNPNYFQDLAWSYHNLGIAFESSGQHAQAEEVRQKALTIREKLVQDNPKVLGYAVSLAASYQDQGDKLFEADKPAEALASYDRKIGLLEGVLRQEPHHVEAKKMLCNGHWMRANALRRLGRYAEALTDWNLAVELDPGPRRAELRVYRAMTLAAMKDYLRATVEARELAADKTLSGERLYQLASVFGLSAQLGRENAGLSMVEQKKLVEDYTNNALALLVRAGEAGFFRSSAARERLRTNKELDILRSRSDFQKWLAQVDPRAKK